MRPRLSYANVVATIALFVALGGSSYAALKLPHNSVGSAQIRAGAVHSSDVADGSLQPKDLSADARGGGGGGGNAYFAVVGAGGKLVRGTATDASMEAPGHYEVVFPKSFASCGASAVLGTTDDTEPPPGKITLHQDGDHVGVQTYDPNNGAAPLSFYVLMVC